MAFRDRDRVVIIRSGNRIVVDPTTTRILDLLAPQLTYEELVQLHGAEFYEALKAKEPTTFSQTWECYTLDFKGRIATSLGFFDRIVGVLSKDGYDVRCRTLFDYPDPDVFRPRWEKLQGEEFRYKQREALEIMLEYENGQFECAPAWGKGTVIGMLAQLLPRAKIAVATQRVPVLHQRLYPELCQRLPSVGVVGGGKSKKGRRVMCYTFGSLHHADGDEDILLVDECHEAAADEVAGKLTKFGHARMFGLSASLNMRLDNKDLRCEALFGPVRLRVTNQQAVREKIILPTHVHWSNVSMDYDPLDGITDKVERKRMAYWTNVTRHRAIKKDARRYDDETQVLISVETILHGLWLQKMLPEFYFVYGGDTVTDKDIRDFEEYGLIEKGFEIITDAQRERWTAKFEDGRIKKAIATTIWNVGVNFKKLQVLVRGDGGASPINDVQIPGRPIRIDGEWKKYAIVHDYLDQFSIGPRNRASGRSNTYHEEGFTQYFPNGKVLYGADERPIREASTLASGTSRDDRDDRRNWRRQREQRHGKRDKPADMKRTLSLADIMRLEAEQK